MDDETNDLGLPQGTGSFWRSTSDITPTSSAYENNMNPSPSPWCGRTLTRQRKLPKKKQKAPWHFSEAWYSIHGPHHILRCSVSKSGDEPEGESHSIRSYLFFSTLTPLCVNGLLWHLDQSFHSISNYSELTQGDARRSRYGVGTVWWRRCSGRHDLEGDHDLVQRGSLSYSRKEDSIETIGLSYSAPTSKIFKDSSILGKIARLVIGTWIMRDFILGGRKIFCCCVRKMSLIIW